MALGRNARNLLFLHLPKTGGSSLSVILENYYSVNDLSPHLVGRVAKTIHSRTQVPGKLIMGHFAHNLWKLFGDDFAKVTVLRHPVERYLSQVQHWIRAARRTPDDPLLFSSPEQADVELNLPDRNKFIEFEQENCQTQNCYLRAVFEQVDWSTIPLDRWTISDVELKKFDLIGIAEDFKRFLYLLCDLFSWPASFQQLRLNQTPSHQDQRQVHEMLKSNLHRFRDDMETYNQAKRLFDQRYHAFLRSLFPDHENLDLVTDSMVEESLNHRFVDNIQFHFPEPLEELHWSMDQPMFGQGWWWRQHSGKVWYRSTGPQTTNIVYLPPLRGGKDYRFEIDIVYFASETIAQKLEVFVNGLRCCHSIRNVSQEWDEVKSVIEGSLPANVAYGTGPVILKFKLPETKPILANERIQHSEATFDWDTRLLGMGVADIRIF
jgi:hypothetical protein